MNFVAAEPPRPRTIAVVAAFAAVYVIWGSTYLAIRIAVETLPPLLMAGVRFTIAGVLMYVWLRVRGESRPTPIQWRSAAISGAFLLLGGNGLVVWAEQTVPSGPAALLVATMPLWIVILNIFWPGGTRPGLAEIAGLALGSFGLVVLVFPSATLALFTGNASSISGSFAHIDPWGAVGLVLASLSWAIGTLYSRRAPAPKNPFVSTSMQMICGGACQLLVGLALGEAGRVHISSFSPRSIGAFAYLIVLGSWIGFTCYVWLLRVTSPSKVATYAYVNPAVAVLLGWMILDEPLTWMTLTAMTLIVIAVVLITTRPRRASPAMNPQGAAQTQK